MKADFPQVTILGGGLLGGSLYLALSAMTDAPAVKLWVRREETAREADGQGIHHVTTDLANAVRDASLIILAVPVGAMEGLVEQAVASGVPEYCVFTDVGSVKRVPHLKISPLLSQHGLHFIGSHPMAGSERNGLSAVRQNLFEGAACLLTNDDGAPQPLATAIERFWQSVGCKTSWLTADAHDELVARISHLPHIIAASGARVCLREPSQGRFGGGGLRDTTRVAGGNPSMWAEILIENREAVIGPLKETLTDLSEMLASLESGNQEGVLRWLETAKNLRSTLTPSR